VSIHNNCGGTVLTGGSGEQAHIYCDRCGAFTHNTENSELPTGTDREANRAAFDDGEFCSPDLVYTFRTDAMHSDTEYDTAEDAIEAAVEGGEWAPIDSERESRDIANGAWLCIYEDGSPSVIRGQMP
jgi:hypothetical protein